MKGQSQGEDTDVDAASVEPLPSDDSAFFQELGDPASPAKDMICKGPSPCPGSQSDSSCAGTASAVDGLEWDPARTHDLLVDRLRFLPNNTVEGDQVILVRSVSGEQASTNLAVGIHIMGEDKIEASTSESSLTTFIIILLSGLVLVLLAVLTFVGVMLRNGEFSERDTLEDQNPEGHMETQEPTTSEQDG